MAPTRNPVAATGTTMVEMTDVRLLQLVSPSLPTGSFAYSQGLEWAVEAGWVESSDTLKAWLLDLLLTSLAYVDLPLVKYMHQSCARSDLIELEHLCNVLHACRESNEMVLEESNRGRAMATLLEGLSMLPDAKWKNVLAKSQLAGFCYAAHFWNIGVEKCAAGYLWAWLENQVLAGVKIIPLGQTAGQKLLLELSESIPFAIVTGLQVELDEVGGSSPAFAMASSLHETQYTRIYRS